MHGTPVKKRFSPSKVALLRVIVSMSAPHCLKSRLPDLRRFSKGSRSALILTAWLATWAVVAFRDRTAPREDQKRSRRRGLKSTWR
jgi:hypothetical protein